VVKVKALRKMLDGVIALPDIADRLWVEMYERLRVFHARAGHVLVPFDSSDDLALGAWVARQRLVRKGKACNALPLTQRQIDLLDELGFRW
jgi:hypothetical protein